LRGARANIAMTSSLAKKAGDTSTVGSHRACSNGRDRKDECGDGECYNSMTLVLVREKNLVLG